MLYCFENFLSVYMNQNESFCEETILGVSEPIRKMSIVLANNSDMAGRNLKSLTLVEEQPCSLKCTVSGGHPLPSLELFLRDINITEDFHLRRACSTVGQAGLSAVDCIMERWTEDFSPPAKYDGSVFKCVASVPGLPKRVATTKLQVLCKISRQSIDTACDSQPV